METEILNHLGIQGKMIQTGDGYKGELVDTLDVLIFSGEDRDEAIFNFHETVEKYLTEF